MRKIASIIFIAATIVTAPTQAQDRNREAEIVQKSLTVLTEVQSMPDLQVPDWLLERAEGIAILPEVIKAGAIVGGRGGNGVLLVRHRDGGWSNPLFIGLGAGSFGWQFGVHSVSRPRLNIQAWKALFLTIRVRRCQDFGKVDLFACLLIEIHSGDKAGQ